MIQIKSTYEPADHEDGYRVLIDRLWPRGMKKTDLKMDEWAKDLAPSNELRKTYHAHPEDWRDFQKQYRTELKTDAARKHLAKLAGHARTGCLTLLSSAKQKDHNHVPVLRRLIATKARH